MMTRALCILVVVFPLCASSRGAQLIGDGLRTVAFQGQAATGTTGQFNDFGGMDINDSGQIAFLGGMFSLSGVTTTTNTGIWVEKTPGQLTLLAREGSTAPGTSGKFGDFVNDGPIINNRGEVAFENTLSSPGLPQTLGNNTGVWSQGGGGVLKLIARSDASAPGTSSIFIGVFATELNNSGGVAFSGNLPTNPPGFGVSIPG